MNDQPDDSTQAPQEGSHGPNDRKHNPQTHMNSSYQIREEADDENK